MGSSLVTIDHVGDAVRTGDGSDEGADDGYGVQIHLSTDADGAELGILSMPCE